MNRIDVSMVPGSSAAGPPIDPYNPKDLKPGPPPPPPKAPPGPFVDHLGRLLPPGGAYGPELVQPDLGLQELSSLAPFWLKPMGGPDPLAQVLAALQSGAAPLTTSIPIQNLEMPKLPETPIPLNAVPQVVGLAARNFMTGGPSVIRVQLNPDHLGPLQLDFSWDEGRVSVAILATAQAQSAMENQLPAIRAILMQHQLPTGELKVETMASGGGSRDSTDSSGGEEGSPAGSFAAHLRRRRGDDTDDILTRI